MFPHILLSAVCIIYLYTRACAGGAIDVAGNVSEEGFDETAEWNIFWDPPAAKRVSDRVCSSAARNFICLVSVVYLL